jgi:hypothetical protein
MEMSESSNIHYAYVAIWNVVDVTVDVWGFGKLQSSGHFIAPYNSVSWTVDHGEVQRE